MKYISKVSEGDKKFCFINIKDKKKCGRYFQYSYLIDEFESFDLISENEHHEIFYVIIEKELTDYNEVHEKERQIYKCWNDKLISISMFYNNIRDCRDGDDGTGSSCFVNGLKQQDAYCKTSCLRPNCTCSDLYYQKAEGGRFPYSETTSKGSPKYTLQFVDDSSKDKTTDICYTFSKTSDMQISEKGEHMKFSTYLYLYMD